MTRTFICLGDIQRAKDNAHHDTTLGAMEASDYQSVYGTTATCDGQSIDTTAVLVKYT